MKKRDSLLIGLSVVVISSVIGCGGGSTAGNGTTVTVERGSVIGAVVKDSAGQIATEIGLTNQYRFTNPLVYPIMATGGIIDINENGQIDPYVDYKLTTALKADKGTNITPLTTYIAGMKQSEQDAFAKKLGVEVDDLYKLPSGSSTVVTLAVNAAYYADIVKNNPQSGGLTNEFEDKLNELEGVYNDNLTKSDKENIEKDILDILGIPHATESDVQSENNDNITSGSSSDGDSGISNDNDTMNDNDTAGDGLYNDNITS